MADFETMKPGFQEARVFSYRRRDVVPDLQFYLFQEESNDHCGVSPPRSAVIKTLIEDVGLALDKDGYMQEMLDRELPDSVRILLEAADYLPSEEIGRRWNMLMSKYRELAQTYASEESRVITLCNSHAGWSSDPDDVY